MDVKYLRDDAVSAASLGQKISDAWRRGVLLADLRALDDLDTELDLAAVDRFAFGQRALYFVGGRGSIVEQLRLVGRTHQDAVIQHTNGRHPLIVHTHRESKRIGKSKTIVQVCSVNALGFMNVQPKGSATSQRIGDYLGTNVAYEATLNDVAGLLADMWDIADD